MPDSPMATMSLGALSTRLCPATRALILPGRSVNTMFPPAQPTSQGRSRFDTTVVTV